MQFGFKRGHSASYAVFVLKSCVDYYLKRGSNVLVAYMDCSKAFDAVSHYGIFLSRLRIIIFLYLILNSRGQWRGTCSDYFFVLTGIKQGRAISPRIFTLLVDDLIA